MNPTKFHEDFDHHRQRSRNMITDINGRRPSPLKINKDSHVIHKLTSSSNSLLLAHNNQQQQQQQKQPVIIYIHSPKVIHAQPGDFMALVQKLTGLSHPGGDHNDDHETAPTLAQETNQQQTGFSFSSQQGY